MTQTIDQPLAERGSRYGEFDDHANLTQGIKDVMKLGPNWYLMTDDMKEALEMVAHKIGRILNGDPGYIDSWTDIIGYTRLVEKRLIAEQAEPTLDNIQEAKNRAARAALDAAGVWGFDEETIEGCDFPGCPVCSPEDNRVSLGEKLAGVKPKAMPVPVGPSVAAALQTLIDAGVITLVEEDGDA
jgi:hypothetical protein